MNRKDFLGGLLPLVLSVKALASPLREAGRGARRGDEDPLPVSIPAYLQQGDLIGICCGSGPIDPKEIQPSILVLESWGFKTVLGQTIGKKDGMFGGTDAERAKDIQDMMDNPQIKAILFARGGYGMVRVVDSIDFSRFSSSPKWLIGFSDVTVIHAHVHRNCRVATIHSKMCNSFPDDFDKAEPIVKDCILSLRKALTGETMTYTAPYSPLNRPGKAVGQLIGGNLRTLENLAGTVSEFSTAGKILFIEDVEEYYYNLDRMLWNFRRTGKLDKLQGLVVGGFNRMLEDPKEPFGKNHYDIITFHTKDYAYPVCFDFPVGHQKNNYPLRSGQVHELEVDQSGIRLTSM
jgi:muramoyltetrapeptide carboxypeptidase